MDEGNKRALKYRKSEEGLRGHIENYTMFLSNLKITSEYDIRDLICFGFHDFVHEYDETEKTLYFENKKYKFGIKIFKGGIRTWRCLRIGEFEVK